MKFFIFAKFIGLLLAAIPLIVFAQSQSPCSGSVSITDTSQVEAASLVVLTNSAQASFNITGPANYQGSGFILGQHGVPAGTYTITWNAVSGCGTPPSETKTTDSRGAVSFTGNYKDLTVPAGYGLIDIKTNLNQSTTFTVSGPAKQTATGTGFTWASAPVGTYTVTYGAITGYNTPPSETKALSIGGTLNFYGNYTSKQATPQIKISPPIEPIPTLQPSLGKAKLVITSVPDGAMVYVNNILAGKAPLIYQVGEGSHKIRCVLAGYDDYHYGTGISDYGARSGTTVEIICKMPPPSSGPGNRLQNLPRDDTSSQEPALAASQKPKGFLSRFWQRILSIFGK